METKERMPRICPKCRTEARATSIQCKECGTLTRWKEGKFQVYANGKKLKSPFANRETAEANAILWRILNPGVKFKIKEVSS